MEKKKQDIKIKLQRLNAEKSLLASRIVSLTKELYDGDDLQPHDLIREQLEAMDKYYQALDARIIDIKCGGILWESTLSGDKPEGEQEEDECCCHVQPKSEMMRTFEECCNKLSDAIDEIFTPTKKGCDGKQD